MATPQNDSTKLNFYIHRYNKIFYSNPDSSEYYLKKGIRLSKKLNLPKKEISMIIDLGILYNETGKIQAARELFFEANKMALNLNDTSLIANTFGNIGNNYTINGEYEKAVDAFNKTLNLYEKINNKKGLSLIYGAMGNLFSKMEKYDNAITFYEKSKKMFSEMNAPENMIALTNLNEGIIYYHQEKLAEAERLLLQALQTFKKTKNTLNETKCLSALGNCYSHKKEYQQAEKFYKKSLMGYKQLNSETDIINSLLNISAVQLETKNYSNALNNALKAYNIALKLNNFYLIKNSTEQLADTYEELNDYYNAYKYSILSKQYNDSILNSETAKKIAELEVKYKTQEKKHKIEVLTKNQIILEEKQKLNRYYIIGLSLIILMVLIIFFMIYQHLKLKEKEQVAEMEQKLFRIQMNPHFIFNALTAIQQFILEKNVEDANKYLSQFSRLMRLILQSTREDFISLKEEIEIIENYSNIQNLLFNNKFSLEIFSDSDIEPENTLIMPMLIQPFVENAIKHGFQNIDYHGKIEIHFKKHKHLLSIKIIDNGKGLTSQGIKTEKHKSMALDITKSRLKIAFKGKLKQAQFKMETIQTNNNRNKTIVAFYLPYLENF